MKLSRLALAVTLAPGLALSATDAPDIPAPANASAAPPLVITRATGLQKPAPASIAVIKRQQIEASAAANLVDLLRSQAGLQIRDTTGDGNRAAVSLRGFGENAINNTLVLVDGRRLNQPALAGPDLNSVPLANIERIEIIRGAGTVLYGDQAVGGVINIVTRSPKSNEAYVESSLGSHDLEAYRGYVSQQLGAGFSAYASGETRNSDNYRDHNNSSYDDAFLRLRHDHDGGWALYEYQTIDDELLYPDSLTREQSDADRKQSFSSNWNDRQTQVHRFALQQALNETWTGNFDYSHSDQDGTSNFYGLFDQGTRVETFSPRLTARWDNSLGRSEWLFGHDHISSDYEYRSAYSATLAEQTQRDWYSQFSQGLGKDVNLTLGYRASEVQDRTRGSDSSSHTDREGSSSLGLSWQATEQARLFVKREDVLRWANVDENAFTLPGVTFLKPQTGVSWESGVEWSDGLQRYQASLYRLDLEDELMYDSEIANPGGFGGKGANINLDQTRRQGLLLEGQRQLGERLSLNGQYSFTDSEYRDGSFEGNEVPWVARHTASAALNYQLLQGLSGYLEAVYTGSRYPVGDDANADDRLGGYTLYNAALKYDYQQFTGKLRVNNLTGKRYDAFVYQGDSGVYAAPEEVVELSLGYRF
ncbi:MAG TPA: TonB-dependent receptor [Pseudomonas sp.]|nr:TonB-dependent receptor [Pseudomonas sp.]